MDQANGTAGELGAEVAFGPRVGPNLLDEILCGGRRPRQSHHPLLADVLRSRTRTSPEARRSPLRAKILAMNIDAYLARIGLEGSVTLSVEGLERLQRAHLTAVPFENLDVFHRRGVETTPEWSVPKIVDRGRGGWCYEVNGAFATLLENLGFAVRWLGAVVLPATGPVPDHLALEVILDRPYLVDVGFGDSFIRPLPLDTAGPHDGGDALYRFDVDGQLKTLVKVGADGPEPQYQFDADSYAFTDFEPSSLRLQTEQGLKWTEKPFATRLLDGGPDRVTLLLDRIKFRRNGVWTEIPVSADEWADLLHEWFGLTP